MMRRRYEHLLVCAHVQDKLYIIKKKKKKLIVIFQFSLHFIASQNGAEYPVVL